MMKKKKTARQIQQLKKKAHALKPVILIGQNGVHDSLLAELEQALQYHQLIKIKLNTGDKVQKKRWLDAILRSTQAELISQIGHIAVIYRRNPDKDAIITP